MPNRGGYKDIDEIEHNAEIIPSDQPLHHPPAYKDLVFVVWYKSGKTNARHLWGLIPNDEIYFKGKPTVNTLQNWINNDFPERAAVLDDQVMAEINGRMIAEKVEMLNRHAEIGKEMVTMSARYLKDHEDELTINSATRLLVAGIEIEQDSRGISSTVKKIAQMSDEQLEAEIKRLLLSAPVEFEAPESIEEEIDE